MLHASLWAASLHLPHILRGQAAEIRSEHRPRSTDLRMSAAEAEKKPLTALGIIPTITISLRVRGFWTVLLWRRFMALGANNIPPRPGFDDRFGLPHSHHCWCWNVSFGLIKRLFWHPPAVIFPATKLHLAQGCPSNPLTRLVTDSPVTHMVESPRDSPETGHQYYHKISHTILIL